jgi:ribonuclease HII
MKKNSPSVFLRVQALFAFDQQALSEFASGSQVPSEQPLLVGIDEAGRGPWAGPVVAAAVSFPASVDMTRLVPLDDSKKLTPVQRESLAGRIRECAVAVGIGAATPEEIDRLDIEKATFLAMRRALEDAGMIPDLILVDGHRDPGLGFPTRCLVKGDGLSASIAAASILAKTNRDHRLELLAGSDDRWGFRKHKGYGTEHHQHALAVFGPSPHHRRSFQPVARHLLHPGASPSFLVLWNKLMGIEAEGWDEQLIRSLEDELPHLPTSEAWLLEHRLKDIASSLGRNPGASTPSHHKPALSARPTLSKREVGAFYESMVLKYFSGKGYAFLERNYQGQEGEIDLIMREEETIVFIEVKARRSAQYGEAISAVTPLKQHRLIRTAQEYLSLHPEVVECRFDVIALDRDSSGNTHLSHFPNAFGMESREVE